MTSENMYRKALDIVERETEQAVRRYNAAKAKEQPVITVFRNDEPIAMIGLSEAEWASINTVDYIEIDNAGKLHPDFDVHGAAVCANMQTLVNRVLSL